MKRDTFNLRRFQYQITEDVMSSHNERKQETLKIDETNGTVAYGTVHISTFFLLGSRPK